MRPGSWATTTARSWSICTRPVMPYVCLAAASPTSGAPNVGTKAASVSRALEGQSMTLLLVTVRLAQPAPECENKGAV